MLIAMPDIFRGIDLNPLEPSNSFYLLWMILGFLIVSSVLVVGLGRLGDIVRTGSHLQPRVRHLHDRIVAPDDRLDDRTARGGLAHRLPSGPGRRRRVSHRQFGGDPHRRVPGQSARARTGHQQHRRDCGCLHRPDPWRPARADQLAARLPRLGPLRSLRNRLGVPEAPGARRPAARADRLARQCHLRNRPDPRDDRHHVRDRAVQVESHGMGESVRGRYARARCGIPHRVHGDRGPGRKSDVPSCSCSAFALSRSAHSRAFSRRSVAVVSCSC